MTFTDIEISKPDISTITHSVNELLLLSPLKHQISDCSISLTIYCHSGLVPESPTCKTKIVLQPQIIDSTVQNFPNQKKQ